EEAHGADMGQGAVALGVVDAVADDELVRDLEADPTRLHVDLAPRRLVEQGADLDAAGVAGGEDVEHVPQGAAGVDDVLDHQQVAALDLAAQVLEDANFTAGFGGVAVGRYLEEVDLDRQIQLAHQIGDEDEGAAQQ